MINYYIITHLSPTFIIKTADKYIAIEHSKTICKGYITHRINIHHRVIQAIGIQVEAVYRLRIEIVYAIRAYKPAGFGVVPASFQIIQHYCRVVIIPAVAERIVSAYVSPADRPVAHASYLYVAATLPSSSTISIISPCRFLR